MVKTKKTQADKTKKPEPISSKAQSNPEKQSSQPDKDTKWSDAGFN